MGLFALVARTTPYEAIQFVVSSNFQSHSLDLSIYRLYMIICCWCCSNLLSIIPESGVVKESRMN